MGKAYDEIMEKIEVTPEMRQRVLEHIAREDISPAPSKIIRMPALKKYLSAAACLVLLLAGAAVLPRLTDRPQPNPPVLTVPNIVEAASLPALSELVGFEVSEQFSLPFEIETATYLSYWNELAEIRYRSGEHSATYRQSPGDGDNSGDYTVYSDTAEITGNDRTVTLKGTNGVYVLALWTDGRYTFSLSLSPGLTEEGWRSCLNLWQ